MLATMTKYSNLLVVAAALVGASALAPVASAETIAVIGTGRVAGALGPQFAKLGHHIVYGSRDPSRAEVMELVAKTQGNASAASPADAVRGADIVVIAVPWRGAEAAVKGLGDLSGKIILDPTNAVKDNPDGFRDHAVPTSAAEMIQGWAPGAHVVKAFNALSYMTMADPASAGGPVTIPICGDDAAAKATVAKLVTGIGFEVVDVGPLRYAHVLEGMLDIWSGARQLGHSFNFYLRPVPAS
jgi:8-hydroxy-5-deazaflavin:NADPH oxidoreductase